MADMKPIGIDQTTGQQRPVGAGDNVTNDIGDVIEIAVKHTFGRGPDFRKQFADFINNPPAGMDPLAQARIDTLRNRKSDPDPSVRPRISQDVLDRAQQDRNARLFSQLLPIRNTSVPGFQEQPTSTNNRVTVNIVVNNPRNGTEVVEQLNAEFRKNPDKFLFGRSR